MLYNFHKYCMISFIHVQEINEQNGVGSFDFEENIDTYKWSHIFNIASKLP